MERMEMVPRATIRSRPLDPEHPPKGTIATLFFGDGNASYGRKCPGCNSHIQSNRERIYCPYCGIVVRLT